MNISIIVPCYNEAPNVEKLQKELVPVAAELAKDNLVEVIIVDDGSQDDTWNRLVAAFGNGSSRGVSFGLIRHEKNLGLGVALHTGFDAAHNEILVTTDSDGTYSFSEIPALLSYIKPGVDIVAASPYHPLGKVRGAPAYRLVLSKGASLIYRLLVSRKIHTYTSLFRAYRRQVVVGVPFEAEDFLAGTELLVNAILAGYHVVEYPTTLHGRVFGISKTRLLRTILSHLRFLSRIAAARFSPRTKPQAKIIPIADPLRKNNG